MFLCESEMSIYQPLNLHQWMRLINYLRVKGHFCPSQKTHRKNWSLT